jgi:hypothetical protein
LILARGHGVRIANPGRAGERMITWALGKENEFEGLLMNEFEGLLMNEFEGSLINEFEGSLINEFVHLLNGNYQSIFNEF